MRATRTLQANDFVSVEQLGSGASWSYTSAWPSFSTPTIKSIQFVPSAAGDKLVVRDGSSAGTILTNLFAETSSARPAALFGDHGARMKPTIEIGQCTFGTNSAAVVIFEMQ